MDAMFDRMDAVGKAFLGLSVACCQCHDHKFDPISQEEYYRLFAFLNNDHEAQRVVYTPAEQMAIAGIREQMREIEDEAEGDARRTGQKRMAEWEADVAEASRSGRRSRSRTPATTRSGTSRRRTARSSRRATPRPSSARSCAARAR